MGGCSSPEILLVTPPCIEPQFSLRRVWPAGTPPMGLLYLASALLEAGFSCKLIDASQLGLSSKELARKIISLSPRIVAFTSVTAAYPAVIDAVSLVRSEDSSIRMVIGGPHASARPMEVWETGLFDAVITGEGEGPLVSLVQYWLFPGEVQRPFDGVFLGEGWVPRPFFHESLHSIPLPARNMVDLSSYAHPGTIFTKRGCPRRCYFCSISTSGFERFHPLERVFEEIDIISQSYGIKTIDVLDDTFLSNGERAVEIARYLSANEIDWTCQAAVVELLRSREVIPTLAECGLQNIFVGMESGSERVMKKAKGITPEQALEAVSLLKRAGVPAIVACFILGHPWDDYNSLTATGEFILRLHDMGVRISVSLLVPYPGSAIGDNPERFGVRILSHDYRLYNGEYVLLDNNHLASEMLYSFYVDLLDRLTA